jgi:hypothetical protein
LSHSIKFPRACFLMIFLPSRRRKATPTGLKLRVELDQLPRRVSLGFGLAFPGLGSTQHVIDADRIEREDD